MQYCSKPVAEDMRLAAVIPSFNGAQFIQPLLASLASQTLPPALTWLVDNASHDETVHIARAGGRDLNVVQMDQNHGYGVACNRGLQEAIGAGAEYCALINQDMVIDPRYFQTLIHEMDRDQGLGALTGFILDYEGLRFNHFRVYLPPEFWEDLFFDRVKPTYYREFVPATALVVRSKMLMDIGGFDPIFFMYSEDNDLLRRAAAAGWRSGISPAARACHWSGLQHRRDDRAFRVNVITSQMMYDIKWSMRGFVGAYLARLWRLRAYGRPREGVAALVKCLLNIGMLRKSRMGLTHHRFASRQPAMSAQAVDSPQDRARQDMLAKPTGGLP